MKRSHHRHHHPFRRDHRASASHWPRSPWCSAFWPSRSQSRVLQFAFDIYTLEPFFRYSPAISARRLKKTTRCHSVRFFLLSRIAIAPLLRGCYTMTLVTAPPLGMYRVSGSRAQVSDRGLPCLHSASHTDLLLLVNHYSGSAENRRSSHLIGLHPVGLHRHFS